MVDSVTDFITVYLGQTLCLALIVCTVSVLGFTLTFLTQCMHNSLCKNWAKQRFLYTIYTHILRCVYLCIADAGGKLWKLAKKLGSVICAMI